MLVFPIDIDSVRLIDIHQTETRDKEMKADTEALLSD